MKACLGIILALGIILIPPCAFGEVTVLSGPEKTQKPDSQRSVPIVLHAAAAIQPALKYQFLPPFPERRAGNAAVWWNRLPAGQDAFFAAFNKAGGVEEKIEKWQEIPLTDPREKALRPQASDVITPSLFASMERAARFESCDWELPFHEGNVIEMIIPEVQQTRTYGRMLSAKARLEIAEGKYDEAVRTMQCGFALARDLGKGQTLIHALVGTAIAGMMLDRVREMIQQPDSPNLYWALSILPRPPVNFRLGYETESNTLYLEMPELKDLDKKQMPPDEWRELLQKLGGKLDQFAISEGSDGAAVLHVTVLALQGYPRAKQYLVEHGRSAAEVDAMPVAQVVLLYTTHIFNGLGDDQYKWMFLPYAEARQGLKRAQRELTEAVGADREIIPVARLLLPAVQACKMAETRSKWSVAQLRILEALRIYAAGHGELPDELSQVSDVPIPVNPFDGKPFTYHRDGDKADLGCEMGPVNLPWRYEITLVHSK